MISTDKKLEKAVRTLRNGGIILIPTDTVWGLSCDAFDELTIKRIFNIKKRPKDKKFLILVNSLTMLKKYVEDIPEYVFDIIRLERPTTIVYPKTKNIPSFLLSKDDSIAIRIVKDRVLRKLISMFGRPIVSGSANLSGEPFPKKFKDIDKSIIESADYILKVKEKKNTKPSLILKIEGKKFKVIRD